MSSLNLKNKAYENLMIEKNKVKTNLARVKTLLKKYEGDIKNQKLKIADLNQEISTLTNEGKLASKECK